MTRADIVKMLLAHDKTDPNLNVSNFTCTNDAILFTDFVIVQFLHYQGFDGFTPLTLAVSKGSADIVALLLSHPGVDVNLREGGGMTPLHLAILTNNTDIVKMLVEDQRLDISIMFIGICKFDISFQNSNSKNHISRKIIIDFSTRNGSSKHGNNQFIRKLNVIDSYHTIVFSFFLFLN